MLRNMLQTLRIIIFTILIFVSACSFTILKETNDSTMLTHSKNISDNVTTTTKSVATSVHYEGEKMGNSSETIERSSTETMTSSENKRKKEENMDCHLAEETKDMLNCFFMLDDVVTQPIENASHKISDEIEQNVSKFNDTYPPKIFPQDKNVKSIDNADEDTRRRLNHSFYAIITPKKVADAFSMGAENKDSRKDMIATSFGNNSGITSQKSASDKGMSDRMIVLTVILTFSIATAIVYAGVIAYKRYLEYRYNRRQLLDNDSEFDVNDLHHFEL